MTSWTPHGDDLTTAYARHTGTLRGALRHALVATALTRHLPTEPQHIVDVGGGAGHQAIILARAGHHVTVIDNDPAMLERAQDALHREDDAVTARVRLVEGHGQHTLDLIDGEPADAACCHGVLMYVDDPAPLLTGLVHAVRPGGLISVLAKNAAALAMRPGLEGRWADAVDALHTDREIGNLGVTSRADDLDTVTKILTAAGADVEAWYGVRVFTDHLGETPVGVDFDQILAAEWQAGTRDPYRAVARLFHLLTRRS